VLHGYYFIEWFYSQVSVSFCSTRVKSILVAYSIWSHKYEQTAQYQTRRIYSFYMLLLLEYRPFPFKGFWKASRVYISNSNGTEMAIQSSFGRCSFDEFFGSIDFQRTGIELSMRYCFTSASSPNPNRSRASRISVIKLPGSCPAILRSLCAYTRPTLGPASILFGITPVPCRASPFRVYY
jgi:hypothetical protein